MLKIISLTLSLIAFSAVIWIVVPAPHYYIWLFSVAASEWSLWLAFFCILAIIFSLLTPIYGGDGKLWIVSLSFSIAALMISFYPFLSALKLASGENVSLSVGEYFSGLKSENLSGKEFTARSFTNVGGADLQFDVYLPTIKNENNGAAVIVVHGGSWNGGVRNDFPHWNRWLAANGFTVFDIDYRLAPQPNYLTATGDVKCAVKFVKSHAAEFGIAPERITLFGRSAGAHLALLAGYSANDARLAPSCENDQDETIRAVVSFYAPVDMAWAFDHPANRFVINGAKTLGDFIGGNPHESAEIMDKFNLATPLTHVSPQTPPTLLVHGGQDQLVRDENMQFLDAKLTENNVSHKTIFIPYAQHGFDYNFHGFGAQIVKPLLLEFLRANTTPRRLAVNRESSIVDPIKK